MSNLEREKAEKQAAQIIEYRYSESGCCGGYMPGCYCREWGPWSRQRPSKLTIEERLKSLRRRYPHKYEFRITKGTK